LRESEEKFRTIVDKASDGILIVDAFTKKFLQGNAIICSMLGYTEEEIANLTIYDIHPPQDVSHVLEEFEKQIKGEKAVAESLPVLRKDGSVFYANVSSASISLGGRHYLVGIFHDITERKRSEEQLNEAKNFLEIVLDNLMEALIVVDPTNYSILKANRSFLDYCGLDKESVISKQCYALIHHRTTPCVPPDVICPIGETLKTGKSTTTEHIHFDEAGNQLCVQVSTVPIISNGGEIRQIIHLSRNVTDLRKGEQTLRQQRVELSHVSRLATVGEFAASIAHEIHQPLTAILNNAQAAKRFLSSGTPAIDEVNDAIQDIINDDRRAGEVIRNLRLFLKREEADRAILDINSTIGDVLTILHGEILDKNVSVTTDLSPDLPRLEGDRVELQQVLMNLILNGCDAMMDVDIQRRQICIRTATNESNSIIVTVQDSGTGLDKSVIERVFEPYYTTKREGLGMGLSISKTIITAHGGRIWAANNPEGGATFSFTLPIH